MNILATIPWLDIWIKYAVLIYGVYYLFNRCVSEKPDYKKLSACGILSVAMGYLLIWLRNEIAPFHTILMLVYIMMTNIFLYRDEYSRGDKTDGRLTILENSVLSLLCFAFCDAIFMIVGFVCSTILMVIYWYIIPGRKSVIDFLNDEPVHITAYIIGIAFVWVGIYLFAQIRRLRRGLMDIVKHRVAATAVMTALLMLMVCIAFSGASIENGRSSIGMVLLLPAFLFCVFMIYWTRREVRTDYIGQIREKNMTILEGILAEKEKEITALSQDNANLAGIISRDAELLRQLADGLESGTDPEDAARLAENISGLYSGRCDALGQMESFGGNIEDTGVRSVDGILQRMAFIAAGKGVGFTVKAQTDMKQLIDKDIEHREFNIILADLTVNAIISSSSSKEKQVEVMLRDVEESVRLEVFDTGERFDTEVLKNMGRKRITTHSDEGGSGIGLMQLFEILKHTGASFTIEEYAMPETGGEFSKAVCVVFDGKGKYRIISDRAEELRPVVRGRFEIIPKS